MSIHLEVAAKAMVLGKSNDAELAMMLNTIPVVPEYVHLQNGTKTQAAFYYPIDAFENIELRQFSLLEDALGQLDSLPNNEPVLLLTPWFGLHREDRLETWSRSLAERQPALFGNSESRIFPFGRSAALMALSYAEQLLQSNPDQTVWLVAVDSLADNDTLETLQDQGKLFNDMGEGLIASEGAVVIGLKASTSGLNIQWSGSDASVESASTNYDIQDTALKSLFSNAVQHSSEQIANIYLPDNGDSTLTDLWVNQYHALGSVLSEKVELHMQGLFTGELGAAGGLYRFLHIYEAYQKQRINGLTLQCEISEKLYRAAALYQWK